jgi:hypothetical protein
VLFQQQIGRGLRLAPGKESCLVLDFVGQHRADFRFDRLLSSLTGCRVANCCRRRGATASAACRRAATSTCSARRASRCCRAFALDDPELAPPEDRAAGLRRAAWPHVGQLAGFLHDQALELDDVYRNGTGQAAAAGPP